jgi:hypothetical protein
MAVWTAPTTRSTGALVSASIWNTDIVENLKYLKDSPVFDGDVTIGDDLFLGSGAVINIASGDVTITHSTNTLTFAGASSGYVFNDGNATIGAAGDTAERHCQFRNNAVQFYVGVEGSSGNRFIGSAVDNAFIGTTGADGLEFATNNTVRMVLTSGGNLALAATARLYLDGVSGTGDTYLTESSSNVISTYTGGVNSFGVNSDGPFVIAGKKLFLDSGGDTYLTESSANNIAVFCGNAERGGFNTNGVYVNTYPTTALAANLWSQNGSNIHISTSSIKYKHDIETLDAAHAQAAVMAMRPVTYRGKTDEDQRRVVGFIAEEMQQIAPLLCTYDEGGESGTPNYVTYDRVTAYLVAVVQQQQAEINALKARIH